MSSRFSHLNNGIYPGFKGENDEPSEFQENSPPGNGAMVITAGIGFRNSATATGQVPEITGSFVTAVINGNDSPREARTTIIRESSNGVNGSGEVVTYSTKPGQGKRHDAIGNVTFTEVQNGQKNIFSNLFSERLSLTHGRGHTNHAVQFPIPNPLTPFQIRVKNIYSNGKTYLIEVNKTDTVDRLKQLIRCQVEIEPEQQSLVFAGKKLACGMTLGHYGIKEDSEILLQLTHLRGG